MTRIISLVLTLILVVSLSACGAEQVVPEIEEVPVVEVKTEEMIGPATEIPKEEISIMCCGNRITSNDILYLGDETQIATVQLGRKKLADFDIVNSNPQVLDVSIEDGTIKFEPLARGESTVTISSDEGIGEFIVYSNTQLELISDDLVVSNDDIIVMGENQHVNFKVTLNGELTENYQISSSKDPRPGQAGGTIVSYKKESNVFSLISVDWAGIYDFTISVNGMSKTFDVQVHHKQYESIYTISPQHYDTNINYDKILDKFRIPVELGVPQYSLEDIKNMVNSNLSLDEVAEKISTVPDLIQYLYHKGYRSQDTESIHFYVDGIKWTVNTSARTAFERNYGNCGGSSNIFNYVLRDDYDSQGYYMVFRNCGGHIFNYFVKDEVYYFFDFTYVKFDDFGDNSVNYILDTYPTTDPQEYSNYRISENHGENSSADEQYLHGELLYEHDGDHLPISGGRYDKVMPKQYQQVTQILYTESTITFLEAPPQNMWPIEAQ